MFIAVGNPLSYVFCRVAHYFFDGGVCDKCMQVWVLCAS